MTGAGADFLACCSFFVGSRTEGREADRGGDGRLADEEVVFRRVSRFPWVAVVLVCLGGHHLVGLRRVVSRYWRPDGMLS